MPAARLARLGRRIRDHLALLRRDPELFGRNLLQWTDPALFERRLMDVLDPPPMHIRFETGGRTAPRLNVLGSSWAAETMTGGPNTALNLALRVARHGVGLRIVATAEQGLPEPAAFTRHCTALLGGPVPPLELASAAAPECNLEVGPGDLFLATHWTTAHQLGPVLPRMPVRKFFYLLQDFEPGFYAWSSNYALALQTYAMTFWPVVNQGTLAAYLFAQGAATPADAIVFEPAVDRRLFHPPAQPRISAPERLLFYARPTNPRNLFGLGLLALRQAAADPVFAGWEFLSIGSRGSLPELGLAPGVVLRPAPWMDYAGYAALLRSADILLCPMLSPHTSYPVLEMVASGGLCVTNTFATKTEAWLAAISPSILAAEPSVAGLAGALLTAATQRATRAPNPPPPRLAGDWSETLDPAAKQIAETIHSLAPTASA